MNASFKMRDEKNFQKNPLQYFFWYLAFLRLIRHCIYIQTRYWYRMYIDKYQTTIYVFRRLLTLILLDDLMHHYSCYCDKADILFSDIYNIINCFYFFLQFALCATLSKNNKNCCRMMYISFVSFMPCIIVTKME